MSAVAYRNYDRAEPPEVVIEDWTPTIRKELSDTEVEAWIADFAETGDIADELGNYKGHFGTVTHACALDWVAGKIGAETGPVFWRWAKGAAQLAAFGQ